MEKIRVLVANQPRLMREVVRAALSEHPDIEVAEEIEDETQILAAIDQTHADCLIITRDEAGSRPAICDCVLEKYPHMKILAVAPGSEDSVFYWVSMEIRSSRIETSEEGVLSALRSQSADRGEKQGSTGE